MPSVGAARRVLLPARRDAWRRIRSARRRRWPTTAAPPRTRVAFAAAHVVADPLADVDPWLDAAIDWDATLAYRRYLWGLGLRRLPRRWIRRSAAWGWTGRARRS